MPKPALIRWYNTTFGRNEPEHYAKRYVYAEKRLICETPSEREALKIVTVHNTLLDILTNPMLAQMTTGVCSCDFELGNHCLKCSASEIITKTETALQEMENPRRR